MNKILSNNIERNQSRENQRKINFGTVYFESEEKLNEFLSSDWTVIYTTPDTDFISRDPTADSVGVVQLFFSHITHLKKSVQIQGRTARQSKRGLYKMILFSSDLEGRILV